jgi:hypothetical protein
MLEEMARPHSRFRNLLPLAVLTAFVGCKGSDLGGATEQEALCDPLAPKPIVLGSVVGVGQDAAGTLYVDSANGVFVSSAGALIRQHVTGSGQSGANDYIFTFQPSGSDSTSARDLLVETAGATATAMALGTVGARVFLNQSPPGVTALTLVDAATVSGTPTVNTLNAISYLGDVANGNIVMATVPTDSAATSTDGGLAIFYGAPSAVAQRPITDFQQSLSGNGTVTFSVDGTPYVLTFGMVRGPDAGPLGMFALLGLTPQGGAEMAVTLRSPTPAAPPPELSFTCLP